jgi:hypothetical protein
VRLKGSSWWANSILRFKGDTEGTIATGAIGVAIELPT